MVIFGFFETRSDHLKSKSASLVEIVRFLVIFLKAYRYDRAISTLMTYRFWSDNVQIILWNLLVSLIFWNQLKIKITFVVTIEFVVLNNLKFEIVTLNLNRYSEYSPGLLSLTGVSVWSFRPLPMLLNRIDITKTVIFRM